MAFFRVFLKGIAADPLEHFIEADEYYLEYSTDGKRRAYHFMSTNDTERHEVAIFDASSIAGVVRDTNYSKPPKEVLDENG
jgi:hypothetical protein